MGRTIYEQANLWVSKRTSSSSLNNQLTRPLLWLNFYTEVILFYTQKVCFMPYYIPIPENTVVLNKAINGSKKSKYVLRAFADNELRKEDKDTLQNRSKVPRLSVDPSIYLLPNSNKG